MNKISLTFLLLLGLIGLQAQSFEFGLQATTGPANTRFKGDLDQILGFSEIEITDEILDSAFVAFDLSAPRWIKELYPGVRVEVVGEVEKKLTRNIKGLRFFFRYRFIGGSFTVSDPRLTVKTRR